MRDISGGGVGAVRTTSVGVAPGVGVGLVVGGRLVLTTGRGSSLGTGSGSLLVHPEAIATAMIATSAIRSRSSMHTPYVRPAATVPTLQFGAQGRRRRCGLPRAG